jgi:hypothetical protein
MLSPHYRKEMFLQMKINDLMIDVSHRAGDYKEKTDDELLKELNSGIENVKSTFFNNGGNEYFVLPHIPYTPLRTIEKLVTVGRERREIRIVCSSMIGEDGLEGSMPIEFVFKRGEDLRKDQLMYQ